MNPTVVIRISLNSQYKYCYYYCGIIRHVIPLELKDRVFLEEEGDHRDILLIGVVGFIHARGEYGRGPLLKF